MKNKEAKQVSPHSAFLQNRRGQVTIFIIIAILIVAAVALFFVLREKIVKEEIPLNIQPIENNFLSCLEEDTLTGALVLESQGGYIELPDYEFGSEYMPFSSQLDFLGNPIPYWYYISGNNIEKEQVPSKEFMEEQLEDFIEEKINLCVLSNYNSGYEITKGIPNASVEIKENEIKVDLNMDLDVGFNESRKLITNHKVIVKSNLGKLYDSAKKVYDFEQENLFLEKYAIDNLRLYAPVDGVEFTCSPLQWNADDVFDELEQATEINTLALSNLRNKDDYFKVDLPVSEKVGFINSRNWPKTFEVLPSEENLLLANPIGNQPELGALGFCYAPYHFVYNIKYPVLVQVSEEDEIFQFPFAVVIQGNNPRKPLNGTVIGTKTFGLCENKVNPVDVDIYDTNLNPVNASVYYECFGERCKIGQGYSLHENFPQCVNGYIIVKADGFKKSRQLFSSISNASISFYLDKTYDLLIELKLDGNDYDGKAIISFISDDDSKTIVYPEQKNIKLSENSYEVEVYIYKNSSIELGNITREQCVDVPQSFGGIFGLTKKKCFNIEFPSQLVSNALAGGGKQEHYILESDLENANKIEINVESLPSPDTIEQIQDNYALFENKGVDLNFK